MNSLLRLLYALAFLVLCGLATNAAVAQTTESQTATPNAALPDDGYIGSNDGNDGTGADAGMVCATLTFSDGLTVADVTMDIGITHTWLGDLTVKVKSPAGTVVAPMVRPTGDATNVPFDDGSGCCGDSSDLSGASPINFDDANAADAETMGVGLSDTDIETGSFFGNADEAANSGLFSTFAGEAADGNWEVCIGDAAGGDTGTFDTVTLSITGTGSSTVTIVQSVPLPIIYDGMYKGTDTLTDTDSDSLAFGEDAGMSCVDVDFTGETLGRVADMSLSLFLDHGRLGDLVVKVRHDGTGTIFTPMNRPDFVFPTGDGPDDGSCMMDTPGCHGDTSDLSPGIPTVFNPLATVYAEDMGSGLGASDFVCLDGGPCLFLPDPDGIPGPSTFQGAFGGKDAEVVWTVCVGDAVTGNSPLDGPGDEARSAPGSFESVALTITGGAPAPAPYDLEASIAVVREEIEVCQGGSFLVDYTITNNTSLPAQGDLFTTIVRSGTQVSRVLIASGNLPPNIVIYGSYEQIVPQTAPLGDYLYTLHIGRFNDYVTLDSETFEFTVIPSSSCRVGSGGAETWSIVNATPWGSTAEALADAVSRAEVGTVSAYPNPFARQTEIAFSTESALDVRLMVYDVLGREVARLVDGPVEAGQHAATFDADGLASGVYVWRLTVNGDVQTGQITLVR